MVLLLGACDLTFGEEELLRNQCSRDDDCAGAVCEPEAGICVTPSIPSMEVGLTVSAPSGGSSSAPPEVALPPTEVDGPLEHDLDLPPSILVAGRIRSEDTGAQVPAQVRFLQASPLEGTAPTELVTSTSPVLLPSGVEADYQLRVVAGGSYDVIVEPTGDAARAFPPLYLGELEAPAEGDVWSLDIRYPASLVSEEGSVFSYDEEQEVPEDGLQVRAVEVATGRVVSSAALTGMTATAPPEESEPGHFTLHLSPGAGPFVLRITAGADRPYFPTLTLDPELSFPSELVVPDLEPVTYEGVVEASSVAGGGPVGDAVVKLRSEDLFGDESAIRGTFRTTVTTDEDGRFTAEVLPGTYDVIVSPSGGGAMSGSEGATGTTGKLGVLVHSDVRIETTDTAVRGQLFMVPLRSQLGGEVRSFDGRPMVGTTVQATALGRSIEAHPESQFNRSSNAVVDGSGLFDLRLDVGVFDLSARPPGGSGFPRVVMPEWTMSSPGSLVSRRIDVPAPVPVRGVVRSADGTALAGAEVEAYTVVRDVEETPRSVTLGRAVTGADGSYELFLAPPVL